MKKIIAAIVIVGAAALYIIFTRTSSATTVSTTMEPPSTGTSVGAATAPTGTEPAPLTTPGATTPQPVQTSSGSMYKDGSYTGSVADAFYGNVQVKAIISGGKITNVEFLTYPSDQNTSRYISSQAIPMLTQEAITAQSANVDLVSGATQTSLAFKQSLANALSQAAS